MSLLGTMKNAVLKRVLKSQLKGVSEDQIDTVLKKFEENPALLAQLQELQKHPEVMELMQKIQAEVEEKVKNGSNQMAANMAVMRKYQSEVMKYKDILEPVMGLFQMM